MALIVPDWCLLISIVLTMSVNFGNFVKSRPLAKIFKTMNRNGIHSENN